MTIPRELYEELRELERTHTQQLKAEQARVSELEAERNEKESQCTAYEQRTKAISTEKNRSVGGLENERYWPIYLY
jgi:rRNA-processing protein FCF1